MWIRFATSSFDLKEFVPDHQKKLFSNDADFANHKEFFPEAAKAGLCRDEHFKNFNMILTSACDLNFATKYLADKIPYFDGLYFLKIVPSE